MTVLTALTTYLLKHRHVMPSTPIPIMNHLHQENMSMESIPRESPFYIAKLGVARYSHFFAPNIDCGYSFEPPRRGGSNM